MEGSTGRQRVPENVLLDLPIPAFSSLEQKAIADVLEAIHRLRELIRRKDFILGGLSDALLHKLMTGEIRVADLDLSALASPKELEAAE
jgi:type I restriction enzyme S subunit